jgi:hypothetical protein
MAQPTSKSGKQRNFSCDVLHNLKIPYRKKLGTLFEIQNDTYSTRPSNVLQDSNLTDPPNAANSMSSIRDSQQEHSAVSAPSDTGTNIVGKIAKRVRRPISLEEKAKISLQTDIVDRNGTNHTNHIVVNLPTPQSIERLCPAGGDTDFFFSIHSSAMHQAQSYYDYADSSVQTKSCLCCTHKSVTLKEKWNPFKPGPLPSVFVLALCLPVVAS